MEEPIVTIQNYAQAGIELRRDFFAANSGKIEQAALMAARAIAGGKKIFLCGNGGSAADAQHVAGELVNRFMLDRPALPAIALTVDTSVITAIGNDFHFDQIFKRQLCALGQPGDVLIAISTSGNSPNVLNAIDCAREKDISVIGLTGHDGGLMANMCDLLINVPGSATPLIQEIHLACEHLLCSLIDYFLFENPSRLNAFTEER